MKGARGRLRLVAAAMPGRTVLTDVYRTAPFHPSPVAYRRGRAVVVLQDVGPGILPGDRLDADVSVQAGACLTVEAPGAARIFPASNGVSATSSTALSVAAGGSLWWLPGTVIPYRNARFASQVHARLEPGATIAMLDVLTPGRTAMGERDAYARLDLRTRIDVAGKPALVERALLDPSARPAPRLGVPEAMRCSGTLLLVGYELPGDVCGERDDVWLGADGGPALAMVRGVARSAATLREALLAVLERLETGRGASLRDAAAAEGRRL